MKRTGVILIAAMVGGCAGGDDGPAASMTVGDDVHLEGRVLEVDATPMFVDGDGEIRLRTWRYGRVLVRVPARERRCPARGLEAFSSLGPGDSLRAVGRVTAPGEVTVCADASHRLEKTGGEDAGEG